VSQYHWLAVGGFVFLVLLMLAKRQPREDRDFMSSRPTLEPRRLIR
jgi:hypothetical protein